MLKYYPPSPLQIIEPNKDLNIPRKTEQAKLCGPKHILSSSHYSTSHFATAAEELGQAPSSLSGSGNTYQVTPLTQVMLSTFLLLLFFTSGQGYRQRCLICLLVYVCYMQESPSHKDSLFIEQQKMFGKEFVFNSFNNSSQSAFQHSKINLFAPKLRVLILKALSNREFQSAIPQNFQTKTHSTVKDINTSCINSRYI